jgi:hypothetical protein
MSELVFPDTVSCIVINEAEMDNTFVEVIFPPGEADAETEARGLKVHPLGAFTVNVTPVPAEKSDTAPSVKMMFPSVVYKGDMALAALSAVIPVPPVAFVIVTTAFEFMLQRLQPANNARIKSDFFIREVIPENFEIKRFIEVFIIE